MYVYFPVPKPLPPIALYRAAAALFQSCHVPKPSRFQAIASYGAAAALSQSRRLLPKLSWLTLYGALVLWNPTATAADAAALALVPAGQNPRLEIGQ